MFVLLFARTYFVDLKLMHQIETIADSMVLVCSEKYISEKHLEVRRKSQTQSMLKIGSLCLQLNVYASCLRRAISTSNISSVIVVLSNAGSLLANDYHEALQQKIREPNLGARLFLGGIGVENTGTEIATVLNNMDVSCEYILKLQHEIEEQCTEEFIQETCLLISLPAVCLLTGKFIVPEISNYAGILFMLMFISIAITGILEMQWGGVESTTGGETSSSGL